ncbi:hypothetical protein [Flavobacterium panici]|uniref:Uncharacterized protein n=1 Tax=Flavobacterium panici TaxID=2654843 RepID=A0A9N8J634_9FLAO|nr:hypothetical protein [Flavobacterium panici]CAC9976154.1 hypothetical protein FLAPXU55_03878 [Flavobacterium panici]
MKNFKYLFLIIFYCSCSVSKDANVSINDYLDSAIKDKNEEIIVVKEKINTNSIIQIFQGNILVDNNTKKTEREGGVPIPLYNENDWLVMKKKYENQNTEFWLNVETWDSKNFDSKRIIFEKLKNCVGSSVIDKYLIKEIPVYSFSEPIIYKNKNIVTFATAKGTTKSFGLGSVYIIVMKKEKGKWMVINKTEENAFY